MNMDIPMKHMWKLGINIAVYLTMTIFISSYAVER